jgi:hypothetical protein
MQHARKLQPFARRRRGIVVGTGRKTFGRQALNLETIKLADWLIGQIAQRLRCPRFA